MIKRNNFKLNKKDKKIDNQNNDNDDKKEEDDNALLAYILDDLNEL